MSSPDCKLYRVEPELEPKTCPVCFGEGRLPDTFDIDETTEYLPCVECNSRGFVMKEAKC